MCSLAHQMALTTSGCVPSGVLIYKNKPGGEVVGSYNIWGATVSDEQTEVAGPDGDGLVDGGPPAATLRGIRVKFDQFADEEDEGSILLHPPWGPADWLRYQVPAMPPASGSAAFCLLSNRAFPRPGRVQDEYHGSESEWESTAREWGEVRGEAGHHGTWLRELTAGAAEEHWRRHKHKSKPAGPSTALQRTFSGTKVTKIKNPLMDQLAPVGEEREEEAGIKEERL